MADDILGFGVLENKKNQLLYAIISGKGVPDSFVTENEEQDMLKYIAVTVRISTESLWKITQLLQLQRTFIKSVDLTKLP